MRVFKAAVKQAEDQGHLIALGGGEPTVHPRFWEMLGHALGANADQPPWVSTNGKKTETAIRLAGLAKKGAIYCQLSVTQFHGEIDLRVIDAFERNRPAWGQVHDDLRNVRGEIEPHSIISQGRWADEDGTNECGCEDVFIRPDGEAYQCGCPNSIHIGNVFDGFEGRENADGEWACSKQVA